MLKVLCRAAKINIRIIRGILAGAKNTAYGEQIALRRPFLDTLFCPEVPKVLRIAAKIDLNINLIDN